MESMVPFKEPGECKDPFALFCLMAAYGYILFNAANFIGDGSELLLLVPSVAGIVGSVILPILGAVPDGMMVLCSGLGDAMEVQEEIKTGLGALAGSSVMLLTLPWFLAILGGRVNLDKNGEPQWATKLKPPPGSGIGWHLSHTGVSVGPRIKSTSRMMLYTLLLYFIAQLYPSFDGRVLPTDFTKDEFEELGAKRGFHFAIAGAIACILAFCGYLYLQASGESDEDHHVGDKAAESRASCITNGEASITGVMHGVFDSHNHLEVTGDDKKKCSKVIESFCAKYDCYPDDGYLTRHNFGKLMSDLGETGLSEDDEDALFASADSDNSGQINFDQSIVVIVRFIKLGGAPKLKSWVKKPSKKQLNAMYADDDDDDDDDDEEDDDNNQKWKEGQQWAPPSMTPRKTPAKKSDGISTPNMTPKAKSSAFKEGEHSMGYQANEDWNRSSGKKQQYLSPQKPPGSVPGRKMSSLKDMLTQDPNQDSNDDDDDEDEMPDDIKLLPPDQQQRAIIMRSLQMMAMGMVLESVIFSDPAVEVLNEIGKRTGVSGFYVGFILAPFASNTSELIAAYNYGCKQKEEMMTVSLSTLLGACCMNNTFVLGIFNVLIAYQGLVWNYTSESILIAQLVIGCFGIFKRVHTLMDALIVLSMFPFSLLVVYGCENWLQFPA